MRHAHRLTRTQIKEEQHYGREEKIKEEKILAPDPEEIVERRYMRESEHGDKTIFCSVNGTAIYVPCGKSVKIKRKYAEVIDRSFTEKERVRERAEAIAREGEQA